MVGSFNLCFRKLSWLAFWKVPQLQHVSLCEEPGFHLGSYQGENNSCVVLAELYPESLLQ